MNDNEADDAGKSALQFPDPRAEAYARAQEFRRLSPEKRFEYLRDIIRTGMILLRDSPKRKIMDQLFLKRETEWQRIQRELFAHGK